VGAGCATSLNVSAVTGWLEGGEKPPGMPGFRDARVYPTAPDIVKARTLVRQAQASGRLTSNDFFSARIGRQTYGSYGMDLAALCLRPARR
jgi:hypothetical protein